jgi:hypothetical protein
MKRMLDFRPHTSLQLLQFLDQMPQFILGQRRVVILVAHQRYCEANMLPTTAHDWVRTQTDRLSDENKSTGGRKGL